MRFGCCVSLLDDTILRLPQAGADYAETGFSTLRDLSLAQCRERAQALEEAGVPVPVMNLLFPGDLALVGPRADLPAVEDYLDQGLEKAALFGVKKLVFGSGGARRVPEGFPKEAAWEQLLALCREVIAPRMEQRGMVCCIEPLNQGECNILNTCAEGFRLAQAVDRPGVRLLVDLYHFDLEEEPRPSLEQYRGYLCHAHIASAKNGASSPCPGTGRTTRSSSVTWRPPATRERSPWRATCPAAWNRSKPPLRISGRCYKENLPSRGGFLICSNLF